MDYLFFLLKGIKHPYFFRTVNMRNSTWWKQLCGGAHQLCSAATWVAGEEEERSEGPPGPSHSSRGPWLWASPTSTGSRPHSAQQKESCKFCHFLLDKTVNIMCRSRQCLGAWLYWLEPIFPNFDQNDSKEQIKCQSWSLQEYLKPDTGTGKKGSAWQHRVLRTFFIFVF